MARARVILILERIAIVIASLGLSIGLIAILSGFFAGQDQAGVSGSSNVPGQQFRDLGHAHLSPGQPRPAYDSNPPTSGAHVPLAIKRDSTKINDDQLLQALEVGDVVIMYGGSSPPRGLTTLAQAVAAPFTQALAAAGQALILARRPGTRGLIGLAWAHMISVSSPSDPRLRAFAEFWLDRGAPGESRGLLPAPR